MPTMLLNNLKTGASSLACALLLTVLTPDAVRVSAQGALESPPAGRAKRAPLPKPKEPSTVTFRVETDQAGCQVYVNGRYSGETDDGGRLALQLTPGVHSLTIRKAGHHPREESVNTARARRRHLPLRPLAYTLTLTVEPAGSDVYLDGAYAGRPGSSGRLTLRAIAQGEHRLTVRAEGFLPDIKLFTLTRDESFNVELSPDPVKAGVDEMRRRTGRGDLEGAFAAYVKLPPPRLGDPAVHEALAATLVGLDAMSQSFHGSLRPDGLHVSAAEARRMMRLYQQASALSPFDRRLASLAHYWEAKHFDLASAIETDAARRAEAVRRMRAALGLITRHALGFAWMNYDAGWCFYRLRDFAAAEESFRAAVGSVRNPAWIGYALARLHIERAEAEPDPARKHVHLTAAVAVSSSSMRADWGLAFAARGVALAKLSKQKEAMNDALTATRLSPLSAYAHYALGCAYYNRKKYVEARRAFEFALVAEEDKLDEPTQRLVRMMLAPSRR